MFLTTASCEGTFRDAYIEVDNGPLLAILDISDQTLSWAAFWSVSHNWHDQRDLFWTVTKPQNEPTIDCQIQSFRVLVLIEPTISFDEQIHKEFPRTIISIFQDGVCFRHAFKEEEHRHGHVLWVARDVNVFTPWAFIWSFGNGIGSKMGFYETRAWQRFEVRFFCVLYSDKL